MELVAKKPLTAIVNVWYEVVSWIVDVIELIAGLLGES